MKRHVGFSDALSFCYSFAFFLVDCLVFFELLVATDARKITNKAVTGTFLAAVWSVSCVLHVSVTALARGTPRVDVKALPSGKPVLTDLFRPSWDELESLAVTSFAIALNFSILQKCFLVSFHQMATKAP